MNKFSKILLILVLILLFEIILIFRGFTLGKKTISPDIEDYNIKKPILAEITHIKILDEL